ncbi:L,D-transpeptidase-like protein [Hyphomicrobiales bacterium]|nr:L,D-transpeptidase-like protein [Hyphomicrobiales bacterium]CAH1670769.1 L,D-transpeptidase-like protein [Hyphomicrobiales bacterium]
MRLKTSLAVLLSAFVLVGCNFKTVPDPSVSNRDTEWMAQMPQAPVDPLFARYEIDDPTGEPAGTIVVKQKERQLYYVLPNKRAMRYGVAVGDEAYGWTGNATVQRKAEWPNWNPPAEMKERWPHVRATAGGPNNPLGARALYLYDDKGRDTLYRIHGTNEPDKIGQAVSSGCIRMRNIDVIDLYNRVEPGSRVVVM